MGTDYRSRRSPSVEAQRTRKPRRKTSGMPTLFTPESPGPAFRVDHVKSSIYTGTFAFPPGGGGAVAKITRLAWPIDA